MKQLRKNTHKVLLALSLTALLSACADDFETPVQSVTPPDNGAQDVPTPDPQQPTPNEPIAEDPQPIEQPPDEQPVEEPPPRQPVASTPIPSGFLSSVQRRINSARYMERNCQSTTYPGWEGFRRLNAITQ